MYCATYYVYLGKKLNENIDDDNDIIATSELISFKDPLTKCRINIPVRSNQCSHNQCFDLEFYILINQTQHPTWHCPICSKPAPLSDLFVDGFFQFLMNEAANEMSKSPNVEIDMVELSPDFASWKLLSETLSPSSSSTSNSSTSKGDAEQAKSQSDVQSNLPKSSSSNSLETLVIDEDSDDDTPLSRIFSTNNSNHGLSQSASAKSSSSSLLNVSIPNQPEVIDLTLDDDDDRPPPFIGFQIPRELGAPISPSPIAMVETNDVSPSLYRNSSSAMFNSNNILNNANHDKGPSNLEKGPMISLPETIMSSPIQDQPVTEIQSHAVTAAPFTLCLPTAFISPSPSAIDSTPVITNTTSTQPNDTIAVQKANPIAPPPHIQDMLSTLSSLQSQIEKQKEALISSTYNTHVSQSLPTTLASTSALLASNFASTSTYPLLTALASVAAMEKSNIISPTINPPPHPSLSRPSKSHRNFSSRPENHHPFDTSRTSPFIPLTSSSSSSASHHPLSMSFFSTPSESRRSSSQLGANPPLLAAPAISENHADNNNEISSGLASRKRSLDHGKLIVTCLFILIYCHVLTRSFFKSTWRMTKRNEKNDHFR